MSRNQKEPNGGTNATPEAEHTHSSPVTPLQWGNATYVSLNVGQRCDFLEREIRLVEIVSNRCIVEVDGNRTVLFVARRHLPTVIGGVRLFLADSRTVAALTSDTFTPSRHVHGLLSGDALLCLSDVSKPLLDPDRYAFPIDAADGFQWDMLEDSHMFAYLGPSRSHEGIDFDLHDGRGLRKHALLAIEDAQVIVTDHRRDGCVILRSLREPHICYVYRHLDSSEASLVRQGDRVRRGQKIGFAWGDQHWGHLHFSVRFAESTPTIDLRYDYLINCFPQCYELWHGDLQPRRRVWANGSWRFFWKNYWEIGNRKLCDGYNEITGRGWELGPACACDRVECDWEPGGDATNPARSVLIRRTLHRGTAAEYVHDANFYRFRVDVPPGQYEVRAIVGDLRLPTWQQVRFNGVDAGIYPLKAGEFASSPLHVIEAPAGKLLIDLHQRDPETYSAISELHFVRVE